MSKVYEGKVSIFKNTKGEIMLKRDDEGAYSNENAAELDAKMLELSKTMKAPINAYARWVAPDGTEPVLMHFYGKPRMTLCTPRPESAKKSAVTKLA